MIVDRIDRRTVRSAVELAARAPSVHNSQPWRWRIGDRTVHLHADLRRWLPVTDADGRDLLLSLGAVLHHLRVALAASGLHATVHRFPNPDALDHVAAVELRPRVPTEADLGFASAIVARRSDRRGYSDWEVPPGAGRRAHRPGSRAGRDPAPDDGGRCPRADRAGRHRGRGRARRTARLPHGDRPVVRSHRFRRRRSGGEPAAGHRGPRAGPGVPARAVERGPGLTDGGLLAVLGTASDDRLSQLRAGEALSAVVLHATRAGLATCPLSEVLEIEETRTALRDEVLLGTLSPQLLVRIGWAPPQPFPQRHGCPSTPR